MSHRLPCQTRPQHTCVVGGYGRSHAPWRKSRRINGPKWRPALPLSLHLRHAQGGEEMGTTWGWESQEEQNQIGYRESRARSPAHKQVARIGRNAGCGMDARAEIQRDRVLRAARSLAVISACSKQEQKSQPAQVAISEAPSASSNVSEQAAAALPAHRHGAISKQAAPAAPKKARRKLAANVEIQRRQLRRVIRVSEKGRAWLRPTNRPPEKLQTGIVRC